MINNSFFLFTQFGRDFTSKLLLMLSLFIASCTDAADQRKQNKEIAERERIQRIERAKQIDEENLKKPYVEHREPECTHKENGVYIGMSKYKVINCGWGKPDKINRTTTAFSTSEQWVYKGGNYLYFEGDRLVAIQN